MHRNSLADAGIRLLQESDVPAVLEVITKARTEYGMAERLDSVLEPADRDLNRTYRRQRAAYFVAIEAARIVGGAGIAPLADSDDQTCELQRMYLLSERRGCGIGAQLLNACLSAARGFGYRRCYAETIEEMQGAIRFYENNGFQALAHPMGNTGHHHNDCWLIRDL